MYAGDPVVGVGRAVVGVGRAVVTPAANVAGVLAGGVGNREVGTGTWRGWSGWLNG